MSKIKVGVLRGGPSSEYKVSLDTGANVLKGLDRQKYHPVDIFISKEGDWHLKGMVVSPQKALRAVDVVFNAMHGEYGEDGKVQQLLDHHKIPYTGSGTIASAFAMQKVLARDIFALAGLKIPKALIVRRKDDIHALAIKAIRELGHSLVIKPAGRGSSVGVTIAHNIYKITNAIVDAFNHDDVVLLEQFIKGREATCGVLEDFRGHSHYTMPVIEIIPPDHKKFFDYECKYDGSTKEICPARFDLETIKKIQSTALTAHKALGCRHYSRTDVIITPKHDVYVLEINTLPGLTDTSLFPQSAHAVGLEFGGLLDHLVGLAIKK